MISEFVDVVLHLDVHLVKMVAEYGIWVYAILFFDRATLHYFALALTIGICFGIYSSVLVAAPLAKYLGASRDDFIKPDKKTVDPIVP